MGLCEFDLPKVKNKRTVCLCRERATFLGKFGPFTEPEQTLRYYLVKIRYICYRN